MLHGLVIKCIKIRVAVLEMFLFVGYVSNLAGLKSCVVKPDRLVAANGEDNQTILLSFVNGSQNATASGS